LQKDEKFVSLIEGGSMISIILRRGITLTDELRVLRLLYTAGSISLNAMERIMPGLKINTLTKIKKDGLILMGNDLIEITEKGIAENEKTLDKGFEA
jgi:hypothetical protein